ncbi:PAS domain S-box protein [Sulfurimonas aquatica]|uniref:histidine kinase n=1 Tax=Sulfurimonas aquatica TaxID=2672570 RepID=A0A975GCV8_9BACT|nr:PAS domain S-box protein [Sulfurimonas aquatica]QSZ41917.1 PAS domain S-box protein [Sulfurimonas aquatica]
MKNTLQRKKEIRLLILALITLALLATASKLFSSYHVDVMHTLTMNIHKHPLKVSRTALRLKLGLYKIDKDMKMIISSESKIEQKRLIEEIYIDEKQIYNNLRIIKENLFEKEGLALQEETKTLFNQLVEMHRNIISLVQKGELSEATFLIESQVLKHMSMLKGNASNLYNYTQEASQSIKKESHQWFEKLETANTLLSIFLLIFYILITYYIIKRISKYIDNIDHLKELYDNTINSVENLIFVKDTEFIYIACNEAFEKFVGRPKEEIVGKNDYDLFSKELADQFRQHDEIMINLRESKTNFEWVSYPDGKKVYLLTVKSPLLSSDGTLIGLVGNSVDITEQKSTEDALVLSKKRYEVAEMIGKVGSWEYKIDTKEFWGSAESHRMYGLKSDSILFSEQSVEACIPEREYVHQALIDLIEKGSEYKLEFRINPADGSSSKIITSIAEVEFNTEGTAQRVIGFIQDVTHQREAQKMLRESEVLFRSIFNQTFQFAGVLTLEGRVLSVNPTSLEFIGVKEIDVIGKLFWETPWWQHSQELQIWLQESISKAAQGEIIKKEVTHYSKTRRLHYFDFSLKPVLDENGKSQYLIPQSRDITEEIDIKQSLQNSHAALEKKSQELYTIIQEAPNPIMLHNEAGEVLMVNKVWENLTGYSHSEINTIEKWTQKAYREKMSDIKKYIDNLYSIKHRVDEGEYSIFTKDGNSIIWQFSSAPLGVMDDKRTVISSAMDITELKNKDKMLMSQSRFAAMGEMIGMIAHQWRQPIAGISMDANNILVDIALDNFKNDDAEKYANDILELSQHLSKTIDDFRNFFKPDKVTSDVSIQEVMSETFRIVKESLKNNNIEFKIISESTSEVNVYPRELMQVFVNIINNAKDALVENNIKDGYIEVKIYDDETYVNIDICDNGNGIDMKILSKIFDPYFTTKDEKNGTGLGLYMSKMIIEDHLEGMIDAHNKEEGACFRVRLLKNK